MRHTQLYPTDLTVPSTHKAADALAIRALAVKWRAQQELNLPKTARLSSETEGTVPKSVPNPRVAADLAEVVVAWHSLTQPLKAAVLAIVRTAKGGRRE
jgi:hypothetical protein